MHDVSNMVVVIRSYSQFPDSPHIQELISSSVHLFWMAVHRLNMSPTKIAIKALLHSLIVYHFGYYCFLFLLLLGYFMKKWQSVGFKWARVDFSYFLCFSCNSLLPYTVNAL